MDEWVGDREYPKRKKSLLILTGKARGGTLRKTSRLGTVLGKQK